MIIQPMSEPVLTAQGMSALPHLGVLRASGEDAAAFLQGQLTQDVVLLPPGQSCLAAWCNAKGRMLASFQVLKISPAELLLVCGQDSLPSVLKRLSLFVLRAKVRLSDASADWALRGLLGEAALASAQPAAAASAAHVLPLPPADGLARALWLAPASAPLPDLPPVAEADWLHAEVRAGVARITPAVAEAFVPQMLNYESVGGVSFKKGCYPGQEVVARSQFRGAIKRRAFVGQVAAPAQAGQPVYAASDAEQPVGLIAQAAPAPGGGSAVIAELQLAAQASGQPLCLGAADGPALSDLHIPYPLAQDI